MDRYLARLEAQLDPRSLRVMQSNGGCLTAASARRQAARTALSGPAGGAVGAFATAVQAAAAAGGAGPNIITFDMGGTSTDVCLCPGQLPFTSEGEIAALGLPLRLPIIDIHTVGAGGGSLARLDLGGALTVGPQSAGADPGPACYGRGGQLATVTDANLVLNRLHPEHFLGGRMRLDVASAQAALQPLARSLGGLEPAAWGILQVANAAMERAIRKISVERGFDPAAFTLVAFGGAGPLHACELAARLSIRRVLVPRTPGVLSALGMLVADLVKDFSTTVLRPLAGLSAEELAALFAPWETRALAEMQTELAAAGLAAAPRLERSADLRYVGQSFELNVPLQAGLPNPAALAADFHARHEQRYGHSHLAEPLELVNLRVRAVGATPALAFEPLPAAGADPAPASLGIQPAWFASLASPAGNLEALPTALYDREALRPGNVVAGPALLFQLDATTVVPPGWRGQVDGFGHFLLECA
jgi:N-methylhydantoinase A